MIRVLVADDHQLLIDGIKSTLVDAEGIEVIAEACNGSEVLDILESTEIDLILMDINMPVMDGLECTKELNTKHPEVKIIAISQYSEKRFIKQMLNNGASGYMLKDSGKKEIIEAIHSVMDGKEYFSSRLSLGFLNKSKTNNKRNNLFIKLTGREREILNLICKEFSTQEISEKLVISFHTVETHRANLIAKSGVKNSIGLVKWAMDNELID